MKRVYPSHPWEHLFFFLYQAFFSVMVLTFFFLILFYCDISASHLKHPVGEREDMNK